MPSIPFQSSAYHRLAFGGHVALAILMSALLVTGSFRGAAVAGVFLLLSFAHHFRDDRKPNLFDLAITVVALLNAVGSGLNLYQRLDPYLDLSTHFLNIALLSLVLFHTYKWRP